MLVCSHQRHEKESEKEKKTYTLEFQEGHNGFEIANHKSDREEMGVGIGKQITEKKAVIEGWLHWGSSPAGFGLCAGCP